MYWVFKMNKKAILNPLSLGVWLICGLFLLIVGAFLIRPLVNIYFENPSGDIITNFVISMYPLWLIVVWFLLLGIISYYENRGVDI